VVEQGGKMKHTIYRILIFLCILTFLILIISAFEQKNTKATQFSSTYIVKPGDTIWSIAGDIKQPGQDIRKLVFDIEQINHITPVIKAGQEIKIPVR
jgi:LysM repeat protein